MKTDDRKFVIEFRSGSFFKGPRPARGGTLAQAMRFDQERHAEQYVQRKAPWVWMNGGMICTVASRKAITARLPKAFR